MADGSVKKISAASARPHTRSKKPNFTPFSLVPGVLVGFVLTWINLSHVMVSDGSANHNFGTCGDRIVNNKILKNIAQRPLRPTLTSSSTSPKRSSQTKLKLSLHLRQFSIPNISRYEIDCIELSRFVKTMNFTCLTKGNGYSFPPSHILNVSKTTILLDCPMDLSSLTIFSPVPTHCDPLLDEETSDSAVHDTFDVESGNTKRKKSLTAKNLIHAVPWYKTASNLHIWDSSSIDIVLISSAMGMLGLPFLTRNNRFSSAKIYATEATVKLGQLMMEDLVSMHTEFQYFYGFEGSGSPQWMKWEELELLPSELKEVALGNNGMDLGGWMPLYSFLDVKDCIKKIHTLKYAEEACYNGTLIVQAFSSGLDIGSCNWTIKGPDRNIAFVSSSIFIPSHAMEFDYHALQGHDLLLYSDFSSQDVIEDVEQNNYSASTTNKISTLSADEDAWKEPRECIDDDSSDESEKLAYICSCVVNSIKAGGSVLIPLNRLGTMLQLLNQIPLYLESSNLKVPIYIISSVAEELLAFTNIIPEWLCKQYQEKLFSGEPLFSHAELIKGKKLLVFPTIHSPDLLSNWQEPCIIFSSHWNLRLGPVVHLLRRWRRNPNCLLVLEDGLDIDVALLPFKPMEMKVLQCSFLSGIRSRNTQPLINMLQPKDVLFPKDLRPQISFSNSDSFSVHYYSELETLSLARLERGIDLEIPADLVHQFNWRKLKQNAIDIARLEGQLLIEQGKHWLLPSGNKEAQSSQFRPFLH